MNHPSKQFPTKKNSWASLAHFCGTGTSSQARNNFVNSDLMTLWQSQDFQTRKIRRICSSWHPEISKPSRFASKHLYIETQIKKNSWIFLRPQHEGSQGHLRIFRCTEEMLQKRITFGEATLLLPRSFFLAAKSSFCEGLKWLKIDYTKGSRKNAPTSFSDNVYIYIYIYYT